MSKLFFAATLLVSITSFATGKVFFISPKDKAVVPQTFKVKMGLKGIKLCEANKEPKDKNCGHHHLIVDGAPVTKGQVVPASDTHIHFGKMQTQTKLTLKPGKHTLTLQFADYAHLSYGEDLSATITIEVK